MKQIFTNILSRSARWYLRRHKPYLIGITGSVGKTTCRMIVTHVMRQLVPGLTIDTSEKNFNSEIGLCLAILGIDSYSPTVWITVLTITKALWISLFATKCADVLVLEYGIDHPGDMDQLLDIAVPHIAILTGIDTVHALYFSDETAILTEKVKLLQRAREIACYNSLLVQVPDYLDAQSIDVLSFDVATDGKADIGFTDYQYQRQDEQLYASFRLRQEHEKLNTVRTNLLGQPQAGYSSLGVELAMIIAQRFTCETIRFPSEDDLRIETRLQEGRATVLLGKRGSLLLDSSYNAAPTSMQMMIALATQIRQELFPERDLILCLGEMRELGQYSDQAHHDLVSQVIHADRLLLVGDEMRRVTLPGLLKAGYRQDRVTYFSDSRSLGEALDSYMHGSKQLACVLFKGSQNTIFLEEAIKIVLRFTQDAYKLCRQSSRWMKKKELFFRE